MIANNNPRTVTALSVAVAIFFIAVVIPKLAISGHIPALATTQGLELLLALLAIIIFGKGRFADYGFCLPKKDSASPHGSSRWVLISLTAPLLGIPASILILALGGSGNPAAKNLALPQIILFVWIFSSVIEEIFTRGFLQGHLSGLSGKYIDFRLLRIELPVLISASFFACIHLVLLMIGADAITIAVTLLFTFSIGLMAGHLRQKTGSLIPAIAVHMLANIGGMIGGIIYAIINYMITGKMPGV